MCKNMLCLILAFVLCLSLSACGIQENAVEKAVESSGNPVETELSEMSETEIFALADRLMQEGSTIFWWYHSDLSSELGIDLETDPTEIDGQPLQKVGRFKTMAELKAATEAVFTREFCETHFYDKINNYEKFKEIDGVLYHNDLTGGMGWIYSLPKEYIVQSVEDDKIVLAAICDGLDGRSGSGDLTEYVFELALIRDNGDWKLNSYYNYTPEGFMGDLLDRESDMYEAEIREIANALLGAGMLGSSWTEPWREESVYDLSFVTFYCMMNQDYTSEIPASDFELFIHGHFDVSTDNLRQIADYDAEKKVYKVSVDISVPREQAQVDDYFRIDSIVQENGRINVSYRILWGKMAATGDGSDTAYAGIITFRRAGRFYPIVSVNVTEDYSDKYDFYDFVPGPGDDNNYLEVVDAKEAIVEVVQNRVEEYRNGTQPDNPNHHPPYPSDFPPVSELRKVKSTKDFAIRFAGNPDALESVYVAVPIGDDGEYELHMTVTLADIDGQVQWSSGNTFFKRVSEIKWHKQDIDLYS